MKRTCLVNGKHTPGSEWERECPLNPNRAEDQVTERERRHQAASPARRAAWAAGAARFAAKGKMARSPAGAVLGDGSAMTAPAGSAAVPLASAYIYRDRRKQSTTQPHEEDPK